MTDRSPQGVKQPAARATAPGEAALMQMLRQAWTLHQAGRLGEAEPLYRAVLAEAPSQSDALHFLGLLQSQRGDREAGLALIDRAIAAAPGNAGAHYNRANILAEAGRFAEAVAGFDRVIAIRPRHTGAWHNRGVFLHQLKRYGDAVASFDRVLQQDANHTDAHIHRGSALHELGRFDEALASYARALAVQPNHVGALFGRGNVLLALKRHDEAIVCFEGAVSLAPSNFSLLNNLGHALGFVGRYEEALKHLNRAITLDPRQPEMFNNCGNVYAHLKRFMEAAASYERALALRPDYPEALSGLGYALTELKQHDAAIAAFERLLALRPDYPYAPGMLIYAKMTACDWRNIDAVTTQALLDIRAGKRVATPIALFAVADSPADHALCSRILIEDKHPGAAAPLWRGQSHRHDRLRVAYVSADFNAHAVATLMAGVFEAHDRARFETIAISHGNDDKSPLRARLARAFDRFIDVHHKGDLEIATLIRDLEIDIAIDLTGLTGMGRPGIFKFRPCGIQVQHLGFAGTMGATYYDYVLVDRTVIPPESQRHFGEKVVYLQDAYLPNDSHRAKPAPTPRRSDWGLPEKGFVFASFNNSYKFSPSMFNIWMRLLRGIDESVLWLASSNETACRNLKREAGNRGVPADQIVFASYTPSEAEHLARLGLADLFLDTLPYNAHSTAADALWAGLPVLTCAGQSFPARVAASLLKAAGLSELVTASLADYEARAFDLARDAGGLRAIRNKLINARLTAPLFDTARFTRSLEAAYSMMIDRQRRGLAPDSFTVPGTAS